MLFSLWLVLLTQPPLDDGFLLVTSEKSNVKEMSFYQLKNLFLGKLESVDSEAVFAVVVSDRLPETQAFRQWLFGSRFDWDNYWSEQGIRGNLKNPPSVGSFALLLAFLERNQDYVGYLPVARKKDLGTFRVKTVQLTP